MSTRALKRLQNDGRHTQTQRVKDEGGDNERGHDNANNRSFDALSNLESGELQATENLFELLSRNDVEDEKTEQQEEDVSPTAAVEENQTKTKKKKKKKKKNHQKTVKQDNANLIQEPLDEIDASVQEVNRILGEPGKTNTLNSTALNFFVSGKSLLHIDFRHLNPQAELRRMFGADVIQEQSNRNRRQRNRPVHRSSRLVQLRDTWHGTGGSGLSMKYNEEIEEFYYEHSLAYQKNQHKFLDAVDSGHPENIINVLRENPYHVDALIQMADLHRINEDYQTAAESIEKALYGLECSFHPLFNLASGKCGLSYKRPENRALFLCLFKHILNLGRRGCNRTAFEFCKLLLSLDPNGDPLDCMNIIDYLALRSEQYDYLVQLEQEVLNEDTMKQVPNFAMSIPLAYFKIACRDSGETRIADEKLQDTLLLFPMILLPLLDECSVQPDKQVSSHRFFSGTELNDSNSELGRLVKMYVKRCMPCWKEAEVMAWLERNVMAVLDIVNTGIDPRLQNYPQILQQRFRKPPLSLLRHYFLSEIAGVGLPRGYLVTPVLTHDPFPPTDSIISYIRPPRPTVASQNQSGFLMSLLQSLLPSYNPNEIADGAGRRRPRDGADDEARAQGIPQQIQDSVNAVMQAMRQLLAAGPQENNQDNPDVEENEGEQEDEN